MALNFLCLNDDETEFLRFSRPTGGVSDIRNIQVGDSDIPVCLQATNFGVILDSALSMKAHIASVSFSIRYHLRRIGMIRKYLTQSASEQLVHLQVTFRLDYCYSLLFRLYH